MILIDPRTGKPIRTRYAWLRYVARARRDRLAGIERHRVRTPFDEVIPDLPPALELKAAL